MEQKVSVTIRIPEDLDVRLSTEAAKMRESRSEFVEESIRMRMKELRRMKLEGEYK